MRRFLRAVLPVTALVLLAGAQSARAASVINVDIYSTFTDVGGGTPFSDLVGSFTSPTVTFGTDTGFNWHPFGLGAFGARIWGVLDVSANGDYYPFTLTSDDGSQFFVDGSLVLDNGGPHPPQSVSLFSLPLSEGQHSFEVDFFEDFGGPSGVDLALPRCDATYCVEYRGRVGAGTGVALPAGLRRDRPGRGASAQEGASGSPHLGITEEAS